MLYVRNAALFKESAWLNDTRYLKKKMKKVKYISKIIYIMGLYKEKRAVRACTHFKFIPVQIPD